MFRTRKARRWLIAAAVAAGELSACTAAHAFDQDETLYSVSCSQGFPNGARFRVANYPAAAGTLAGNALCYEVGAKTLELVERLFRSLGPFELYGCSASSAAGFTFVFGSPAAQNACTATLVEAAKPEGFQDVKVAVEATTAAVGAVNTSVQTVKAAADSIKADTTALKGGAEPTGVDWVMVGKYWLVALATVMGLYFTAMVCGQLINLLRHAR